MQTTKIETGRIISLSKKDLLWTTSLMISAVIVPAVLAHTPHNQWITGTIVNAVLFIAAWKLGIINAAFIAILPSSIALMRGLLLPPQAMIIPFIIVSNILLIGIFTALKRQLFFGVFIASSLKFLFLAGITSLFFAEKIPTTLLQMMQWPQLITALAGGFIAIAFINKFLKN